MFRREPWYVHTDLLKRPHPEERFQLPLFLALLALLGTSAAIAYRSVGVVGRIGPVQLFWHGVVHSTLTRVAG